MDIVGIGERGWVRGADACLEEKSPHTRGLVLVPSSIQAAVVNGDARGSHRDQSGAAAGEGGRSSVLRPATGGRPA